MLKTLHGLEGNALNLKTSTKYKKYTINIILDGERLDAFPLKIRNKRRGPLSPLLFNSVLEKFYPGQLVTKKKEKSSRIDRKN